MKAEGRHAVVSPDGRGDSSREFSADQITPRPRRTARRWGVTGQQRSTATLCTRVDAGRIRMRNLLKRLIRKRLPARESSWSRRTSRAVPHPASLAPYLSSAAVINEMTAARPSRRGRYAEASDCPRGVSRAPNTPVSMITGPREPGLTSRGSRPGTGGPRHHLDGRVSHQAQLAQARTAGAGCGVIRGRRFRRGRC